MLQGEVEGRGYDHDSGDPREKPGKRRPHGELLPADGTLHGLGVDRTVTGPAARLHRRPLAWVGPYVRATPKIVQQVAGVQ